MHSNRSSNNVSNNKRPNSSSAYGSCHPPPSVSYRESSTSGWCRPNPSLELCAANPTGAVMQETIKDTLKIETYLGSHRYTLVNSLIFSMNLKLSSAPELLL